MPSARPATAISRRRARWAGTFTPWRTLLPEPDETYLVKFNNSDDDGDDGECTITIKDDDGVGIYDLEIRSVPGEIPWGYQ